MTVDDLMEKVEPRMGVDYAGRAKPTPDEILEATCWFVACKEAEDISDAWSAKDYARAIRDGEKLGGPYETREHLEEWVRMIGEWDDGEGGDPWDWLDEALDRHFGVTRKE